MLMWELTCLIFQNIITKYLPSGVWWLGEPLGDRANGLFRLSVLTERE